MRPRQGNQRRIASADFLCLGYTLVRAAQCNMPSNDIGIAAWVLAIQSGHTGMVHSAFLHWP